MIFYKQILAKIVNLLEAPPPLPEVVPVAVPVVAGVLGIPVGVQGGETAFAQTVNVSLGFIGGKYILFPTEVHLKK
jgi:hypothetical protein